MPHSASPLLAELDRVLVDKTTLQRRIAEMGKAITTAYAERENLTMVAVINGALVFAADLMRAITLPVQLDCLRVSSYQEELSVKGRPEIIDPIRLDLRDQHVLIVDDILDTGRTLQVVLQSVRRLQPASLSVAVLVQKAGRCEVPLRPDFVGFTLPDEFVVGYGLDFAERYRNLPCIGTVRADLQNPPVWR